MGLVVKDVDKTIEYLSSWGIGPFEPAPGKRFGKRNIREQPADYKLEIRVAQVGLVQIELLQPLEGDCLQRSF